MGRAAANAAIGIATSAGWSVVPQDWVRSGALLDADLVAGRYFCAGSFYATEAEWLAATGGSKSGITRTITPKVVGPELLVHGTFDSDSVAADGWVIATSTDWQTYGSIGWDAGAGDGRLALGKAAGGSGGDCRFGLPVIVERGKCYFFSFKPIENGTGGGGTAGLARTNFATNDITVAAPWTAGQTVGAYGSAGLNGTEYVGFLINRTVPWTYRFDNLSLREVAPLAGHNYLAMAGIIKATTPTVASGTKVVFQADDGGEFDRLRLAWGGDRHLHFLVNAGSSGTIVADLDLGIVEGGTKFEVRFSAERDNFKASLNGAAAQADTSGSHPGLGFIRIGRSFTGETWDGSIERVSLFSTAFSDADMIDPHQALAIYGDSTAHTDGNVTPALDWDVQLAGGYSPARSKYNAGIGGQGITDMRDGLLTDTAHRAWTTIMMDRPNTGETGANWIAAVKAAVANLTTPRWLVVPPVLNSPAGGASASDAAILYVQAALLSDPFFAGHTFDGTTQAASIAASNDDARRNADGIHFNDAGQTMQATTIRAWLDAAGW